jgi:2-C-methyl-D-erythritol 2,4-cyclodiphosphate synthase
MNTAFRIGHGYDLHRLEARPPAGNGRELIIGGVKLASERGPVAHSDGDVLYHAVVDALMGALGLPDIGQMFPDNAPENAGRDSAEFVRAAAERVESAGYAVGNIDATVILERPRIGVHKEAMRRNIASLLGIEPGVVNMKGKSHEGVDALGEGRAVEAHVVVMLVRAD